MSTRATGDGRADAVGAADLDETAAGSDPAAAVTGEREGAGDPSEGVEEGEPDVAGEAPDSQRSGAPADDDELAETAVSDDVENSDPDEADAEDRDFDGTEASDEAGDPDQAGDSVAAAAGDEGHWDDEVLEHDGEYEEHDGEYEEHDEDYEEHDGDYEEHDGDYEEHDGDYEPEEAAGPQRARRWPRALLALGFLVLAAAIVGGAVAIVGSVTHGFKKPVKVTYKKSALFSLKSGECFNPQGQSYALVSCDSPHDAEVFATFTLSGSKWPGAAAVAEKASSGCSSRLTGYLNPQLAISLSSTYIYPDSVAWQAGTRTVICEVRASSGQLTGSVRRATATAG